MSTYDDLYPNRGLFYDGNWSTAVACGPVIWEQPFDQDNTRYVYSQEYTQSRASYAPTARGTAGPNGGFLAKETTPEDIGAGMCKFKRIYTTVPGTHYSGENFVYNFQYALQTDGQWQMSEVPMYVPSKLEYDYFLTSDPTSVEILKANRLVLLFNVLYFIGIPFVDGVTWTVGENSVVRPWIYNGIQMGDIYERVTRYVQTAVLTISSS